MIRFILALALAVAAIDAARSDDTTPRLRELVTVTAELVRIGDLVENAGAAAAEIAVFRAPDLGQTGSVPIAQVMAALRQHDIGNVQTDGLSEVVVTRISRAIAPRDIENRIARALAGHRGMGPVDSLKITLDRDIRPLHVEVSATADLAVTRLNLEPRTGRFDVSLELPGSATSRRIPLRLTGTVSETIETATLLRAIGRSEVIRASDVVMERRPKSEVQGEPLELDQVVGLAAKRALRAGQAPRAADLAKPEAVVRNEPVTIVYEVPGILLTVRGKALESGSVGDHVSVLNVQSNRTVQASIAGPGKVVVNAMPRAVASVAPAATPTVNQ